MGWNADVAALRERLTGRLVLPSDDQYETARAGFQVARAHRPVAIVAAAGSADVQRAVGFAVDHGLPVAVQGTGHALAATASEGGMLITTAAMASVEVGARTHVARISAGSTWEPVLTRAGRAGVAPLAGQLASVGAVSYTLGGGLGPLARRFGYAADHVRAVEIVAADSRIVRTSPWSEPELFWGVRGGRDNFGIATAIEVDLMPVSAVFGGTLSYPAHKVEELIRRYAEWSATAPESVTSSLSLVRFPDLPSVPNHLRGHRIAQVHLVFAPADTHPDRLSAQGERIAKPLRDVGGLLTDSLAPITFAQLYSAPPPPPGATQSTTVLTNALDDDVCRALADAAMSEFPDIIEIRPLGGAIGRPPVNESAIDHRDAAALVVLVSRLTGRSLETIDGVHDRVIDGFSARVHAGRLLNFMGGAGDGARTSDAFEAHTWRRLRRLKTRWDPGNVFRLNHNIPPLRVDEGGSSS